MRKPGKTVIVIVTFLGMAAPPAMAQSADGADVLEGLGVTRGEIEELESGDVLTFSDEAYESTPRELSADAVVLVDTDLASVVEALRGAVTVIPHKLMIDHAEIDGVESFDGVRYTAGDIDEVRELMKVKAGKDFNLSDAEIAFVRKRLDPVRNADADAQLAAASEAMRDILVARYQEYRAGGLDGIGSYARSRRKQVDVGRELKLTTSMFEPFEPDFPAFYRVMASYPDGADCCEHSFRWLKVKLRKRPSFALAHTMIQKTDNYILYTERFYFVNNSLNSVQITLSWLPYDENTYMGLGVSASADVLDSMMGKMLRPVGRNLAKDLVGDVMVDIREDLQGGGGDDGND